MYALCKSVQLIVSEVLLAKTGELSHQRDGLVDETRNRKLNPLVIPVFQ